MREAASLSLGLVEDKGSLVRFDILGFVEENSRLGVWTWDFGSQKMEWSWGLFRLLGLEPGQADPSYTSLEKMVHPEDVRQFGEMERLLREGGKIECEFRIVQNNGRTRWVQNRGEGLQDRAGRPSKAIGVVTDITTLHDSVSRLEALEARHRVTVEATSAVVWSADARGYSGESQSWLKLTGDRLARLNGEVWLDLVHPDDRRAVDQGWRTTLANRVARCFECRLRRIDGEYRWVQIHAEPIFRRDSSLQEWLCVCVDIHERKIWAAPKAAATLTGAQIRAARGILNLSVRELSHAAKTSPAQIRRLEEYNGSPVGNEDTIAAIQHYFECGGVEFLFPLDGRPGVRTR